MPAKAGIYLVDSRLRGNDICNYFVNNVMNSNQI